MPSKLSGRKPWRLLTKKQVLPFILIFAAIGSYLIWHAFAYTTNSVKLDNDTQSSNGSTYQCGSTQNIGYVGSTPYVNNNKPVFNMAADGGLASYQWFIDGVSQGTVNGTGFGYACAYVTTALSEGTHAFTATELAPKAGTHTTPDPLNFVVDTIPPPAPSTPTLASYSDTGVIGDGITSYQQVAILGTATPGAPVHIKNGAALMGGSVTDSTGHWSISTGVLAYGTYQVYAVAYDSAINESAPSPTFTLTIQSSTATVPGTTVLSAISGNAKVTLTWVAPGDGGSPITSYNIYRSTSPGTETLYKNIAPATSYVDTAVTSGQIYYYKIAAINAIGTGPLSSETSATPTGTAKPGDVNGDGSVGILDLSIMASHWGLSGQTLSTGDLNGDGNVNILDLSIIATNWNT